MEREESPPHNPHSSDLTPSHTFVASLLALAPKLNAVVCLCAVLHRGSNYSLARAMDGRMMRCGVTGSCQPAATFKIVKRFLSRLTSLTRVSRAIASIRPLPLPLSLQTHVTDDTPMSQDSNQ